MADTIAGRRLTEAHRRQQLAVKATATRDALRLWGVLNIDDLDVRTATWLNALSLLAQQQADRSLRIAASYYAAFARAETGRDATPSVRPEVDVANLQRNLLSVGPIRVKQLIARGYDTDTAARRAAVAAAGELARAALAPHRDMLTATVGQPGQAAGWARVTDGDPCAFCAMLASRGAVYRSQGTGGFQAHGSCGCTVEPVWRRGAPTPGRAEEFSELWNRSTQGLSGQDAVNAFRRAYERPALNL